MPSRFLEEKGQSVLIDLMIGITMFLLIIASGTVILDNQINSVKEQQELLQQQNTADTALNQLVSGTGATIGGSANWEEEASIDNVKFIGLALTDRVILPAKINKFKEYANNNNYENYDKTKGKLLMGYDYYFRLFNTETNNTMKGCPTSNDYCEAGKAQDYLLSTELKKIDTMVKARRVVSFYQNFDPEGWVSVIAEITVFKTR